MSQYEQVKEYISKHPGTTRRMLRKDLPKITHEHELLKRLVESGDGYREKIIARDKWENERSTWGYFLN